MLYSSKDLARVFRIREPKKETSLRSPFRRDFARLIHSPAFRRLQGKTQLFPGVESDFFRNRLTHSLEVAQIAKGIAIRINSSQLKNNIDKLDLDLVEFAGLAHDLGHPPFGHNGEEALDECMRDAGGFEGNAQTLRILAKLEKKGNMIAPFSGKGKSDSRTGLNLTYRTLASILKYDKAIPVKRDAQDSSHPIKGYYNSEEQLVKKVKENVIGATKYSDTFKTIECQIMDLADDIAYSTYDLEDALKAGFISPIEIVNDLVGNEGLMKRIAKKIEDKTGVPFTESDSRGALARLFLFEVFEFDEIDTSLKKLKGETRALEVAHRALKAYETSHSISQDGYFRNTLTSELVDKFIKGIRFKWQSDAPAFSKVYFTDETFKQVEVLKNYNYEKLIQSSRVKVTKYRGYQIVKELFQALNDGGALLMPHDFKSWYDAAPSDNEKKRVICDFIAGMTDSYAIEFYGRLKSDNPQSIFKPI